MRTEFRRRNSGQEKRKDVNNINNIYEKKEKRLYKGKRKINIIGVLVIITVIMLACVYGPRAIELYNRYKEDNSKAAEQKEKKVIYPLEIKLDAKQILKIDDMLENYFKGIKTDVNSTDGFSNKEMIEFGLNILSEKYSSSGIVPSATMDSVINTYFGVEGIDYKKEGYGKLKVKTSEEKEDNSNTYVFAKIKQMEKDSDTYELEAHEISAETAKKEGYEEKDIISKKIITVKKIVEIDEKTQEESSRYVFAKSNV